MKLYKVLDENGRAYHGGTGTWPLPNGQPGAWLKVGGRLRPCHHGLHLCRHGDLLTWLGPTIFEAECEGEKIIAADKLVVRKARLLRKLDGWNERTARLFAADCAERALKHERKAGREPDPRSWAAVVAARAYANGEISAAARAAAGAAAWDAAGAAALAAARSAAGPAALAAAGAAALDDAGAAARGAAWGAAGAAARSAARGAAWGAARGAAWDAERRWQTKRLFEYAEGVRN